MNSMINHDITRLINQQFKSIVCNLAVKYNFDEAEAITYLENYNNIPTTPANFQSNEERPISTPNNDIPKNDIISNTPPSEKKKRGRPKKAVDETASEDKPKKKRGRPKKENNVTIVNDTDDDEPATNVKSTEDIIASSNTPANSPRENDDDRDEHNDRELEEDPISDIEIDVQEWSWKGDKYLKDENDTIYCTNTHQKMGRYCANTNTIICN